MQLIRKYQESVSLRDLGCKREFVHLSARPAVIKYYPFFFLLLYGKCC